MSGQLRSKKTLYPLHSDVSLPSRNQKRSRTSICRSPSIFSKENEKPLEMVSSESYNSASLRSVPFEIRRYYTGLEFTENALDAHHVLLEWRIYTLLHSPEFKIRKRKESCLSSCGHQVYKSGTTPPISFSPFRLVHLGTYKKNTSTHPSSFLIPTSSSSQKYDFQN